MPEQAVAWTFSGVDHIVVAGVKGYGVEILEVIVLRRGDAFPICAFVGRAINAGQRACEPSFRMRGGLSESANGFVSKTDVLPCATAVVAAGHPAATGVEAPSAGKDPPGITGIDDNMRDYVILAGADSGQKLPVRAFVGRREYVAVRSAQIKSAGVAGICAQRDDGASWRADLAPSLRRCCDRRCGQCQCRRCQPIHTHAFSQSAEALTRRSVGGGVTGSACTNGRILGQLFTVPVLAGLWAEGVPK